MAGGITRRYCILSVHSGSSVKELRAALCERGMRLCISHRRKGALLKMWREDRRLEQIRINESNAIARDDGTTVSGH